MTTRIDIPNEPLPSTNTIDAYNFYHLVKEIKDEDHPDIPTIDFQRLTVNYVKFIKILKELGYRRIEISGKFFMVKIEDNVIQEVNQEQIIDTFMDHLENMPPDHPHYRVREKIQSAIIGRISSLFSDHILHRMKDKEQRKLLSDNKGNSYFFYRNGCINVTKAGIKFLKYKDIDSFIFKDKILDRDFQELPPDQYISCPWAQFCNNIADNYFENGVQKNPLRFRNLKRIIGYLLHAYFEGKLKAIILTDSRISDEADGRTGKTLLCKGLGHMLNANTHSKTFKEINGKDFDPMDRFKWQELGIDTRLVHLNDCKKYFPFDVLFNDISEGIKRQRKNEEPFHVMVKMILSTNRTIKIHGASSEDRSLEFELADYYSQKFSPEDEFKHWFFRDWTPDDWNQFDNFMISCVQEYLKNGLTQPESINLQTRKLIEETQPEFIDYMEAWKPAHLTEYCKKEAFEKFIKLYHDFDNPKFKQRKFNIYLRRYAEFRPEIKQIHEIKSNGRYFFKYEYEPGFFDPDE